MATVLLFAPPTMHHSSIEPQFLLPFASPRPAAQSKHGVWLRRLHTRRPSKTLKTLVLIASVLAITEARPAQAQYLAGLETIAYGGIALTGLVLAGGIASGIGNTYGVMTDSYQPGWVVPGFIHAALGIVLGAFLIPLSIGNTDDEFAKVSLTMGIAHASVGFWNLVAASKNSGLKRKAQGAPMVAPVVMGDRSSKAAHRWIGVGVQISQW